MKTTFKTGKAGSTGLRTVLILVFAFVNGITFKLTGQSWQIFTTEYTYNAGSVNLENTIKSKNPVDVIVSKEGIVWLSCADQYPVSIKNINTKEYLVEVADKDFFKGIEFVPSEKSKFVLLPDGEIILITQQNLVSYKNQKWTGYTTRTKKMVGQNAIPVLKFDLLGGINIDKEGNLWVSGVVLAGNEMGLAKLKNDEWEYYMAPADVSSALLKANESEGIKLLSGKEMGYAKNPALKILLTDIVFDSKGSAWMRAGYHNDLGLCKFSNGIYELLNKENGKISSGNIFGLTSNKGGIIHFTTPDGLFMINSEDQPVPYDKQFSSGAITFDNQDLLWLSNPEIKEISTSWKTGSNQTMVVITRYDTRNKSTLDLTNQNTPLINEIKKTYVDETGTKYFLVEGTGLYILKDVPSENFKNWTIYSSYNSGEELMAHYYMTAGYNDKEWNFYGISDYGSRERLLNILKDGTWSHSEFKLTGEPTGLLSVPISVQAIVKDKNGDLLLGTTNYLYKLDKQSSWIEGLDQGKVSKSVNAIASDNNGILWLGTNKGLARYDYNSFTYFDKNSGLPDNWILSLLVDHNNRTWIGTPNGILCMQNEKNTLYNKKNGLDRERVVAIVSDSKGKVWFGITNFNMTAKALYFEEDGQIKQEALPMSQYIEKMVIDKKDNIWISDGSTLLCRKNNGEYIEFNEKNSPLKPAFKIDNLFVVGDELWLMITTDISRFTQSTSTTPKPASEIPVSKEVEIANSLRPKLSALRPLYETLVFKSDDTY